MIPQNSLFIERVLTQHFAPHEGSEATTMLGIHFCIDIPSAHVSKLTFKHIFSSDMATLKRFFSVFFKVYGCDM